MRVKKTFSPLKLFLCLVCFSGIVVLSFCQNPASEPLNTTKPEVDVEAADNWVIIDHKLKDFGGSIPNWVSQTSAVLEQTTYVNDYVFIFTAPGKNKERLEGWAAELGVVSVTQAAVSERVKTKIRGLSWGSLNIEPYLSYIQTNLSGAPYPGLTQVDKYWVYKQNKIMTSLKKFEFFILIIIPRQEVNSAIQNEIAALGAAFPENTESQTVIATLSAAFGSGL